MWQKTPHPPRPLSPFSPEQLLLELLENLIKMLAFFVGARIDFYEFAKNSKWKQQQYYQKTSEYLQKYQTYVCMYVYGRGPAALTQSSATECRVHKSSARLSSVLIQLRICLIKI